MKDITEVKREAIVMSIVDIIVSINAESFIICYFLFISRYNNNF